MPDYIQWNSANGYILHKWFSVDPSTLAGLSNILQISRETYNLLDKFYLVENSKVRLMNQAEIDALLAAETKIAIVAENARILALDNNINNVNEITLAKIDAKINAIESLADAKVFLKKMCRYIIKFIAANK